MLLPKIVKNGKIKNFTAQLKIEKEEAGSNYYCSKLFFYKIDDPIAGRQPGVGHPIRGHPPTVDYL